MSRLENDKERSRDSDENILQSPTPDPCSKLDLGNTKKRVRHVCRPLLEDPSSPNPFPGIGFCTLTLPFAMVRTLHVPSIGRTVRRDFLYKPNGGKIVG